MNTTECNNIIMNNINILSYSFIGICMFTIFLFCLGIFCSEPHTKSIGTNTDMKRRELKSLPPITIDMYQYHPLYNPYNYSLENSQYYIK